MDACAALREKLTEIKGLGPAAQYGLFLADEDPKKGTAAILFWQKLSTLTLWMTLVIVRLYSSL